MGYRVETGNFKVRLEKAYKHYCDRLGCDITPRTWDRMILAFDLEHCSPAERGKRLNALAEIRSENSRIKMDLDLLQRYQLIRSITSPGEISGIKLLAAVRDIKPISESQFRIWCDDSGIEFSRRSVYKNDELWKLLGFISLRMPNIQSVVKLAQLVTQKQLTAA